MEFLKKLLKRALYTLIAGVVLVTGGVGIMLYLEEREKQRERTADLLYRDAEGWQWQNTYTRIQFKKSKGGETIYRVVDRKNGSDVVVSKDDLNKYSVLAIFPADCDPETEIDTGQEFASGNPKMLYCAEDGEALAYALSYTSNDNVSQRYDLPTISDNFGGFQFSVDLGDIDFSDRDREITLSKAKPISKD